MVRHPDMDTNMTKTQTNTKTKPQRAAGSNASSSDKRLQGKRICALFTSGVELLEFTEPVEGLREAGAEVVVVGLDEAPIKTWNMTEWDRSITPDMGLAEAAHQEWDALFLPGGPLNADVLRSTDMAVFFVNEYFFKRDKPVGAMCHSPWMMVEADVLRGRTMTCYPAIATDMRNAGAIWVNRAAVVDGNLVTARHPADTPEFIPAFIDLIATYEPSKTETSEHMKRSFTPKDEDPKTGPSAQPGA